MSDTLPSRDSYLELSDGTTVALELLRHESWERIAQIVDMDYPTFYAEAKRYADGPGFPYGIPIPGDSDA